ncbi:hypothetical protein BKA67DRAFT_684319 [Truncatella angustata]|uniref:Uncharacterized protein n=1 Tax=Truncatella angustata TaxID=152316 RepID=A0A9P8UC30_9PEZI|nr:uncharacterized protein BKA67DRAFT_684319 [Truncatella angustata]KAH6646877.1 hypothetical protein BKA67DRAFT_684319 [Truncatella angustata]
MALPESAKTFGGWLDPTLHWDKVKDEADIPFFICTRCRKPRSKKSKGPLADGYCLWCTEEVHRGTYAATPPKLQFCLNPSHTAGDRDMEESRYPRMEAYGRVTSCESCLALVERGIVGVKMEPDVKEEPDVEEEPYIKREPDEEEPYIKTEPDEEEPYMKLEPDEEEPYIKTEPDEEEPYIKTEPDEEEGSGIKREPGIKEEPGIEGEPGIKREPE